MDIVQIDNLSKNYGKVHALKQVNFSIPAGTVFGILGPNGSGKTTLLSIVMDVLKPNSGGVRLFGEKPSEFHRKQMGTLLETPNFYHYLSGEQNLRISAAIKGRGEKDIDKVLQIVDLLKRKNSPFSTYSLGMKQRLAIAAALLGDPEVLVFDEPTNGLDPVGIAEIRELIKKLSLQGKTIIMASHLLDEVEKVCTHVAILKQGTLVACGDVNEILVNEDIVELASNDVEALKVLCAKYPGTPEMAVSDSIIKLSFPAGKANLQDINRFCFDNGIVLSYLNLKKKSLESKFFELTN